MKFGITQSFACSYLADEQEQLLVYADTQALQAQRYTQLIQAGFRRSGGQIYRPHCPFCKACQSIRLLVNEFTPSRSQKRVLKKNQHFTVKFVSNAKQEYFRLYERYITKRHADGSMYPPSQEQFDNFVQCEWMDTYFLEAYDGDTLIAVAVTDVLNSAEQPGALSALYTFFDPDYESASLGTWMILKQIQEAQVHSFPYLYLGYYVEGCNKMSYKHNFYPFEEFVNNQWHRISSK